MNSAMLNTTLSFAFRTNKLVDNRLHACLCEVTMDIEFDRTSKLDDHKEQLTILRYWVDNILDDCIAFNLETEVDTGVFGDLDNHIMFCPGEPHDYLLLLLIVAKINSIGRGSFSVIASSINSDSSRGFGNTFMGDPTELLPDGKTWMGDKRYFENPWWERPDGSMMDMIFVEGEDILIKPDILIDLRSAAGLNSMEKKGHDDGEIKEAEIIKPNFGPKIVK